ncbi:MAG TPA: hypothetical protein VNU01_04645 [Egibacteraceae bacterium]|nr:hypothetical protein [Egibacteraceae bacterium]
MDLQINQDAGFQWREWAAQRVGWTLMSLLVLAAVVGLLGPGPLSWSEAASADESATVDYLRWARRGREAGLTIRVDASHVRDGQVTVDVPARYFQDMRLRGVTPSPEQVQANGDLLRFVFAVPQAGARARLEFDLEADGMGPLRGEVRVGTSTVRFSQFIWP